MARKVTRWTEEALNALRYLFENGHSVARMASYYEVSRIRIYQLLKQAGVNVKLKRNHASIRTESMQAPVQSVE